MRKVTLCVTMKKSGERVGKTQSVQRKIRNMGQDRNKNNTQNNGVVVVVVPQDDGLLEGK